MIKKFYFGAILVTLFSCSSNEDNPISTSGDYKSVEYVTITNENKGGGSQFGYFITSFNEENAIFCFCEDYCSREIINVFVLEYNENSYYFRYKIDPSDEFVVVGTQDWCTRFNWIHKLFILRIAGVPNKLTSEVKEKLQTLVEGVVETLDIAYMTIDQKPKLLQITSHYILPRLKSVSTEKVKDEDLLMFID